MHTFYLPCPALDISHRWMAADVLVREEPDEEEEEEEEEEDDEDGDGDDDNGDGYSE
jgi:hypothetical protein